jgi:hypothetical protein
MPYYILHNYKVDHHYACVDVISDRSFDRMPYHTPHICKGNHHYVCVHVLSECSFY